MAEPDSGCGGAGELQDGSQELLSRYIFSLRDRVTTRSHAVKPDKQPRLSMKSISNHSKTAFDQLSTSDYSSSSSHDRGAELVTPPSLSPSAGSPASRPGSSLHCTETDVGWDSEGGEGGMVWESQAEYEHFCAELKTQKGLLVELGGVRLLAPPSSSPLSLQMEPSPPRSAWPTLPASREETLCCVPVSPAVTVEAGQSTTFPRAALLMVPLDCEVDQPDLVSCLYREPGQPAWQPLPHHCATARCQADTILLTIRYTGSFLVVYEEPAPTTSKKIRRRIGGRLKMSHYAENLEVKFPRGSCQEDIVASLKILGNLQLPSAGGVLDTDQPLACPVIMLEPHGVKFNQTSDTPVEIQLPVPDYDRIQQLQPRPELLFYHAAHSGPTKLLRWERMELAFTRISRYRKKGAPDRVYVTFPVTHFSFFKVVWDTLSSSLYGAKLGFSYLAPNWVTFPMKCRAYMEENKDNNTFGLEVVCYNIENNPEQTQNSNYKYLVGSSSKPRLVKPGSVKIKLNSQKFRPDTDAGEDDVMEKFEEDFRGRDFAKEFACIFKETSKVDQGTFGKVQVQRIDSTDKQKIENLFEFNLKKSGNETEKVTTTESDQWSCMAIKELAGNLNLHDDKNWRMFAKYIGFTNAEVDNIQYQGEPFIVLMTRYKERGGSAQEFLQNMYAVSRDSSLCAAAGGSGGSHRSPGSSSSGVSGSGSQASLTSHHQAGNLVKRFSFFGLQNWQRGAEDSDSGTADLHMDSSPAGKLRPVSPAAGKELQGRKRSSSGKIAGLQLKRRKVEAGPGKGKLCSWSTRESRPEDSFSSSDESGAENCAGKSGAVTAARSVSTAAHLRNPYRLQDQDLWSLSSHMASINWRALGRTLGLEEAMLINTEHAHKGQGVRECSYQMLLEWKEKKPRSCTFGQLYTALTAEKMNGVAKNMAKLYEQGQFKSSATDTQT